MGRYLVDATDVDEAEEQISQNYSDITMTRIDARQSPARTRIWRQEMGQLKVDDSEFSYGMHYDEQPSDDIFVVRVLSGRIDTRQPGRAAATAGPNEVLLLGPQAGLPFAGSTEQPRHRLIAINRIAFADAGYGVDEGDRNPLGSAPISAAAGKAVADAIDYLRLGVMANPAVATNELMAAAALQYLVSCVIAAFANSDPWVLTAGDQRDCSERNFRRAAAYVDAHANLPLTDRDIARQIRMSTRSLKHLFARYGSCRPMDYVRRIRLHHAREEMLASASHSVQTTTIAQRWGFADAPDFIRMYRREFRQDPFVDPHA